MGFTGINNGALGTVIAFGFKGKPPQERIPTGERMGAEGDREIPIVFVQMDEDNSVSVSTTLPAVIPFGTYPSMKPIDHSGVKYFRYQLPLIPAHCQTIHGAQGLTAPGDLCIDPSPNVPFEMALEYVAISRVTTLSHLHTLNRFRPIHFTFKHKQRKWIHDEMDRLRQVFGNKNVEKESSNATINSKISPTQLRRSDRMQKMVETSSPVISMQQLHMPSQLQYYSLKQVLLNLRGTSKDGQCSVTLSQSDQQIFNLIKLGDNENSIRAFLITKAELSYYVVRSDNYQGIDLYRHCKPDGLCSLRASRLANLFHWSEDTCLPSDVNIECADDRQTFIEELIVRRNEVGHQLEENHLIFVNCVIARLLDGNTGFYADNWPCAYFLQTWIKSIPWAYFCKCEADDKWDLLAHFNNLSNIRGLAPYTFPQLYEGSHRVKSRIKFNDSHFFLLPAVSNQANQLREAMRSLMIQIIANSHAFPSCALPSPRTQTSLF